MRVRGHLIKFDEDTLNTFLKTPVVVEEGETDVSSIGACRPRIFFINGFLCFLEDEWQRNGEGREREEKIKSYKLP